MQRKIVLVEESTMSSLVEVQLRPGSPLGAQPRQELPASERDSSPRANNGEGAMLLAVEAVTPSGMAPQKPRRLQSAPRRNLCADAATDTSTQMRGCHICFEKLAVEDGQRCDDCSGFFCPTCFRWYIEYKIQEGEVSERKMVCPTHKCLTPLSEEAVASFVAPESLVKYHQFLENQQPGVRFCPRPGCCAKIDEPAFSTALSSQ
ncbi:hypothetical protein ATCC90586_007728 [Pythium insidiosum]|nr:hypothetical protein ATCC90586_007728 [Pythium insidiosum]